MDVFVVVLDCTKLQIWVDASTFSMLCQVGMLCMVCVRCASQQSGEQAFQDQWDACFAVIAYGLLKALKILYLFTMTAKVVLFSHSRCMNVFLGKVRFEHQSGFNHVWIIMGWELWGCFLMFPGHCSHPIRPYSLSWWGRPEAEFCSLECFNREQKGNQMFKGHLMEVFFVCLF